MALQTSGAPPSSVWRVGFRADPWQGSDWKWANDGRFYGRWDDAAGNFRTLHVAESLLARLLEVLAPSRPDRVSGRNWTRSQLTSKTSASTRRWLRASWTVLAESPAKPGVPY